MKNLILNFTATGMILTKVKTPNFQVSSHEIIDDFLKASELGITMAHLHAREVDSGEPTSKKEIYADIIGGIQKHDPKLVICASFIRRNFCELAQRRNPLSLKGLLNADMRSLTLIFFNFNTLQV